MSIELRNVPPNALVGIKTLIVSKICFFSTCPKTTGPICHSFFLLAWGLRTWSPTVSNKRHPSLNTHYRSLRQLFCVQSVHSSHMLTSCPGEPSPGQLEEVRACQHRQQQTGESPRLGNCFRCDLGWWWLRIHWVCPNSLLMTNHWSDLLGINI